jgi:5-formyltetrahydrofolate cyclo-ligase
MTARQRDDPDKSTMRAQARSVVAAMGEAARAQASHALCRRIQSLSIEIDSTVVLMYLAMPSEPNVDEVIRIWMASGATVVAPRADWTNQSMIAAPLTDLDDVGEKGPHQIREPLRSEAAPLASITLAFVPGLAFDDRGGRLGRGAGFFDRFLADLRHVSAAPVYGVAFDEQIVPRVPMEDHDIPLDAIVTPSGWLGPHVPAGVG